MKLTVRLGGKRLGSDLLGSSPASKRVRGEVADIIRLDVSGRRLVAPRTTVAAEPEFLAWLSQRDAVAVADGRRIMVDGDGQAMADALAFFAEGKLPPGAAQPLTRSRLLALTNHMPMPTLRAALKATVAAPRPFVQQGSNIPTAPPEYPGVDAQLARLDFGGRVHVVRRDVLARQGGMLTSLCAHAAQRMDAGEAITLEEDGEAFATAYIFMCDGALPPPPFLDALDKSRLRTLAKNWCLDSLLQEVEVIYPLREAVRNSGQQPAAYYALADALECAGRRLESTRVRQGAEARDPGHAAVAHYEKVAAARPAEGWVLLHLGRSYRRICYREKAIAALRRACAALPEDARARAELAGVLLEGHRRASCLAYLREAIAALKVAVAGLAEPASCWQDLGKSLLEMADLDAARHAFEQALVHAPNLAGAHHGLAHIALRRGDDAESARVHAEQAVRLADSPSADMHATLGAALLAAASMSDEEFDLLRAGGGAPHIRRMRQMASDAASAYGKATKLQRTRANLSGRGQAYLRLNQLLGHGTKYLATARDCFLLARSASRQPCAQTSRFLVDVYTRLGCLQEVHDVRKRIIEDFLLNGMASKDDLDAVAAAFTSLGQRPTVRWYHRAAHLEPQDLSHYLGWARAAMSADVPYAEACKALPGEAAPHLAFAELYLQKGLLQPARQAYEQAQRVSRSGAGWYGLSQLAAAEGKLDAQLRALTQACGCDGRKDTWHLERADLLEKLGLHAAAETARNLVHRSTPPK